MKKLAIGCGVVLVLISVAVGVFTYYVYRQASAVLTQLRELDQLPEIERGVRVQTPFAPPASDELTATQVERLVKVQAHVRQKLGQRFAVLETKYKALIDKQEATVVDVSAIIAAYRDIAAAWMEAKRSQVDALNEAGLSLDEYRWIRDRAYRALGMPFVDLDVTKIIGQIRSGRTNAEPGQLRGSFGPAGPEANVKVVQPFKKQLEESLPLAAFGL